MNKRRASIGSDRAKADRENRSSTKKGGLSAALFSFGKFMADETEKCARVAKFAGIKAE